MKEHDDRVDYVKLEKEKVLTRFYIMGYNGLKYDGDINNLENKEAYNLGVENKKYEK